MVITTNIRLPQEQWKALKIAAVHAGTSVSALVRQAIGQLLKAHPPLSGQETARKRPSRRDPFFEVIGLGTGGPANDSSHHDDYLYR